MQSPRPQPPVRCHHHHHHPNYRDSSVSLYVVVVVISCCLHVLVTMTGPPNRCGPGEWQCGSGGPDGGDQHQPVQCIGHNRFCDGIENCDDGSDEPVGCTNCNRTFVGEANIKFPVRVTGPFQRYLPFVCQISFVAGGKEYGDFVELTFLSFQIGTLEFTRNQTPVCQKGYLKISEQTVPDSELDEFDKSKRNQYVHPLRTLSPDSKFDGPQGPEFGQFCGALVERSVTYFSEGNNVSIMAVVPSRASIPTSSFSLYLTYRFLSRKFQLPHKNPGVPFPYLGGSVPGTYCDRIFHDCSSPHRKCTIRSPNFPGFYPRNVTCQYSIRQQHVPEGFITRIILSQPNDYKISVPTGRASTTTGVNFLLSTDCLGGDIVRIYDGPTARSPILLEFCGSGSLPDVVSSKGEVFVQIYSAPYQLMRTSRVELDVHVRFEKEESGISISHGTSGSSGRCSQTFHGSRQRWGLVKSPNYSMPKNANCSFRFVGASSNDRVWIYFVSFYALMEKRPTAAGDDPESCSSKLELYDSSNLGNSSATTSSSRTIVEEPIATFCGEVSPKICAHAADYPPQYLPPRPCDLNTESYLSTGSEFTIMHRFLSPASEVVTTTMSSFVARYEFVDTRQSGTPIDHSECDRRFDSRLSKTGSVSNPRNVFLYGRGGKPNVSCMFHFIGLPSEKVRIILRKVFLVVENSTCKMSYDTVMQKHTCKWQRNVNTKSNSHQKLGVIDTSASIAASEYWDGYTSTIGCLCNASVDTRQPPVVFESLVSNVKLTFTVNQMSTLKDYDNYGFYADYEFVNFTTCERGMKRQTGATGEGVLNFQVPPPSLETTDVYQSQPVRCRWLIEASPHKYLYLKFKGLNTSSAERCHFGNRILVYLDPKSKPVANACVDEVRRTSKETVEEFDIFSRTWYNETHGGGETRDRIFVEVIANQKETRSNFDVHWLEVTKPFVRTQSGQTMRNVDCLFECPEIGACIDPELWCDGTIHCPSGLDESLEHCRTFPTAYVSSSVVGLVLVALLIAWIVVRRRRTRRRLKKKDIRRLPQDDCLNMESPVG